MSAAALVLAAVTLAAGHDVVARVGSSSISADALARRMAALERQMVRATPEQVLGSLVDETLLADEARRMGLAGTPAVQRRVDADVRRAAGEAFVAKEISARVAPDDKLLRDMFHSTADSIAYESLVFQTEKQAQEALERVRGGATFESEARGAVVSRLGNKAPVVRGELDRALASALFSAPPGALVGPVQLRAGVAIARASSRQIGSDAAFAERRPALVRHVKGQLADEMKRHAVQQLRAKAAVVLDEKFLAEVGGEPTPDQLARVIATVGGRPLEYRDVHATLAGLGRASGHLAGPSVRTRIAWQEIDSRLLQDVAMERGYGKDPELLARVPEFERSALAHAAAERIAEQAPAPSEKEIAAYYERNAARFGKPFGEALPGAAAGARREKQAAALAARVAALRSRTSISTDGKALARVVASGS